MLSINYSKDYFVGKLKAVIGKRDYNYETLEIEGRTFVDVPVVKDVVTGKSLGFSGRVMSKIHNELDVTSVGDVVDYSNI